MTWSISRRNFIEGGVGLTVANFLPGTTPLAFAATMEESIVAAGKTAGAADVNGMIWSPYLVPMQPVIAEFKKETGIGVGAVQDISIFDAPQRAMAEALSRSPQFDFIHIDSNMIPSLPRPAISSRSTSTSRTRASTSTSSPTTATS